jgi:hypothetical protein
MKNFSIAATLIVASVAALAASFSVFAVGVNYECRQSITSTVNCSDSWAQTAAAAARGVLEN